MSSIIHWDMKNFETDAGLAAPFYLSRDENKSPAQLVNTDYTFTQDGPLVKVICESLYFPNQGAVGGSVGSANARDRAQRRLDVICTAMRFSPPDVKNLARGKAISVNANQNYGNLINDTMSENGGIVLDRCWLHEIQIIDGQNIEAVKLQLTFARVSDAYQP